MSLPQVSICIPAYKADRFLAETLESVRAQTFTDWEVIVTEDGSRDRAEEIVKSFAASVTQPVRYTRHDPNRGLSSTRNAGFAAAAGRLLAILDADDLWRPGHLATCQPFLGNGGLDLVFGGCSLFDSESGALLEERVPAPGVLDDFARSLCEGRIVIQPSTVVLRRELLDRCGGFDPRFPICNDLEFWFRASKAGLRLGYSGAVTCDYRKHAGALSNRGTSLAVERAVIHRIHRDWTLVPPAVRRRLLWRHHRDAARMLRPSSPARAVLLLSRGALALLDCR